MLHAHDVIDWFFQTSKLELIDSGTSNWEQCANGIIARATAVKPNNGMKQTKICQSNQFRSQPFLVCLLQPVAQCELARHASLILTLRGIHISSFILNSWKLRVLCQKTFFGEQSKSLMPCVLKDLQSEPDYSSASARTKIVILHRDPIFC